MKLILFITEDEYEQLGSDTRVIERAAYEQPHTIELPNGQKIDTNALEVVVVDA